MVTADEIRAVTERIVRERDPDSIYLFGSYVNGEPDDSSDVDFLVLERDGDRKLQILQDRVAPHFRAEIHVYDRNDAYRRFAEYDPVIRAAIETGQLLYRKNGMTETVEQWMQRSHKGLRAAHVMEDAGFNAEAWFHAQQAVEKMLKAALMHYKVTPPREHDLDKLSQMLTTAAPEWSASKVRLDALTAGAVKYRYEDPNDESSSARMIGWAEELVADLERLIRPT